MELGLTFPLRRFPKMKTPAYGTQPDRHFFWISLPERHKNGIAWCGAVLIVFESQKVTVRLGSVKEEKVAVASVRAKTVVLPSPGV